MLHSELHDDTSAADKLLVIALASLLTVSVISAIGYVIVVVLAFVYTRCDDVCLLIANNLKFAKSQLTDAELDKVSFVSVTIDWRYDSPEVLGGWAEDMGLDWPHLTDWNSDEIINTYREYNVVPYDDDTYQDIHLQPVYILDTNLDGRVVWSEYDWPIDLFVEDLRTVIDLE